MKILFIISHFPPKWIGGAETYTYNFGKYLIKQGHEVCIITTYFPGIEELKKEGFRIYPIKYTNFPLIRAVVYTFLCIFNSIRIKPDIIHGHMLLLNSFSAIIAGKLLKKKSIVQSHGSDIYKIPWILKMTLVRFVIKNSGIVIAITNDIKRKMREVYDRKDIYFLPNAVDTKKFNLNKKLCRENLMINKNDFILIFVGRLEKIKGVNYLLEALKYLKRYKNIKLLLIGEGSEMQYLKELSRELDISESVVFLGNIPNNDIPKYLCSADIFILPSLSEGCPITILEALATGLPVICSKVGGLPEIIQNGENGFLVSVGDSKSISEHILRLMRNKKLMNGILIKNKKLSLTYDYNIIYKNYIKILNGKQNE